MRETKHTPGPWRRQGDTVLIPYRGPHNSAAAFCGTPENAALVEVAPDMFRALQKIAKAKPDRLDHSLDVAIVERMAAIAQHAIAKATGG